MLGCSPLRQTSSWGQSNPGWAVWPGFLTPEPGLQLERGLLRLLPALGLLGLQLGLGTCNVRLRTLGLCHPLLVLRWLLLGGLRLGRHALRRRSHLTTRSVRGREPLPLSARPSGTARGRRSARSRMASKDDIGDGGDDHASTISGLGHQVVLVPGRRQVQHVEPVRQVRESTGQLVIVLDQHPNRLQHGTL